jgi:hypothetical protein
MTKDKSIDNELIDNVTAPSLLSLRDHRLQFVEFQFQPNAATVF